MRPAILIAAALLATPALASPAADARKAIDASNAKWMAAVAKGDASALVALYADDAELLPEGGPVMKGRAAIEQFFAGMQKMGIKEIKLTTTSVEVHGDVAIETGTYSVTAQPPGGGDPVPNADEGKSLVVWKKGKGGHWSMYRDIWNTSKPMQQQGGSGSGAAAAGAGSGSGS